MEGPTASREGCQWPRPDCLGIPSLSLPFGSQMLQPSLRFQYSTLFSAPGNIRRVNYFSGLTQTAFFCQRILSAQHGPAVTPGEGAFVSYVSKEAPLAGRPKALELGVGSRSAPSGWGRLPGREAVAGRVGGGGWVLCEKPAPESSHHQAAFQPVPVGPQLAFHFVDWRLCS